MFKISEGQINWKKAENCFEGKTKTRDRKTHIFIIFRPFQDELEVKIHKVSSLFISD